MPEAAWDEFLRAGIYRSDNERKAGFTRCCPGSEDALLAYANSACKSSPHPWVVLALGKEQLGERLVDGEAPVVKGPLYVADVSDVRRMPRAADGRFLSFLHALALWPSRADQR